jgi:preprotein translocase subunit Sss1
MKKRVFAVSMILIIVASALAGCASKSDTPKYNAIHRVAKLPDTEEYQVDGQYVDVGIVYTKGLFGAENEAYCVFFKQKENIFLKILEFFIGGDTTYSFFRLNDDAFAQIAQAENLKLPAQPKLPFLTEYWLLLALSAIVLIIIVYFIVKLVRR